jgi:hypothetical protein
VIPRAADPCPRLGHPVREIEMLFGSRLGLDDFTAHVMTTIRADHVRRQGGAALLAIGKLLRRLEVVRPTAARPRVALASFWNGHDSVPSTFA